MHIGFLSCFSAWHTEVEIADYLELHGHTVDRYHFPATDLDRFINKSKSFDLFITSLPHTFTPDWLRKMDCPKVAWYFDWIRGYANREAQYIPALKHFDLTLSTDGWIDLYEQNGIKREWMPHACDLRTYRPVSATNVANVGFIGHVYTKRRERLMQGLKRYGFTQFGGNEECWGPPYSEVCNSVKIMVGDNYRNDIPGYWSDRLYLSLGSGAFLLYPRVPGIERYFEDGKHLVCWDDEADLHEKVKYYLKHPGERQRIANAGAAEVAKNHNWYVRTAEALKFIEAL